MTRNWPPINIGFANNPLLFPIDKLFLSYLTTVQTMQSEIELKNFMPRGKRRNNLAATCYLLLLLGPFKNITSTFANWISHITGYLKYHASINFVLVDILFFTFSSNVSLAESLIT